MHPLYVLVIVLVLILLLGGGYGWQTGWGHPVYGYGGGLIGLIILVIIIAALLGRF